MPLYYPIFLDLRGRRVVVVGGGAMGEEKVVRLLEYGPRVVVVSPDVTDRVAELADSGEVEWTRRAYQHGDLQGAFVAIVADTSDDAMNRAVSNEARERNVPLNVADVTELCTWITPSVARRGEVVVATSTGGASPALARLFREVLNGTSRMKSARGLMELADIAPLLSDAREELRDRGVRIPPDHWQASITDDLIGLVQANEYEQAKQTLMDDLLVAVACGCTGGACRMYEETGQANTAE